VRAGDRTLTLLGGLAALAVLAVLLSPGGAPDEAPSRPVSEDRGRDGLRALERWLERDGVRTSRLRRRYGHLRAGDLRARGNLLVLALPQRLPARRAERAALRDWLARGNSALVLAAAADRPRWSRGLGRARAAGVLEEIGFGLAPAREGDEDDEPRARGPGATATVRLEPVLDHPVTRGVRAVELEVTPSPLPPVTLVPHRGLRARLALLARPESGRAALWEVRVGDGRVWLSAFAGLAANASLARADNARLLSNLVGAALAPGGAVVFDDMHQGLTDLYDPTAFYADPRLHRTLLFLLGLWLLWLVGSSQRLAPPRRVARSRTVARLAGAAGGLLARRVEPRAAAERLLHHFTEEVRRRHGRAGDDTPTWDYLERRARLPRAELEALRDADACVRRGDTPDPVALANLLARARAALR